jgi:hypothetical protein
MLSSIGLILSACETQDAALLQEAQQSAALSQAMSDFRSGGWTIAGWENARVDHDANAATAVGATYLVLPMTYLRDGSVVGRADILYAPETEGSHHIAIRTTDAASDALMPNQAGETASDGDWEAELPPEANQSLSPGLSQNVDALTSCGLLCGGAGIFACLRFTHPVAVVICGTASLFVCDYFCRENRRCVTKRYHAGATCLLYGKWVYIPSTGLVHLCNGYGC